MKTAGFLLDIRRFFSEEMGSIYGLSTYFLFVTRVPGNLSVNSSMY